MPIPKPKKGESKKKFISRCMSALNDEFPDDKQRSAVCFDSFKDNTKHGKDKKRKKKMNSNMITFKAEAGKSRRETFNEEEHLVIPVIALVEGVLQASNSDQPELALASEFGKAPKGWNGRPVTINHPEIRGEKVSANSPEVLESEQIGQLFNTVLDGKKLKTEAWINLSRSKELGEEIDSTVERLLEGEVVEISTGLFSDVDEEEGIHEGEKFSGVWRNVVPDHLAVLTSGNIGACSIADGCGANRANCSCNGNCIEDKLNKSSNKRVASNSKNLDDRNDVQTVFEKIKSFIGIRANKELSHNTILRAIESALSEEDGFSFVVDVFKDHFVVQTEGGLFRRNFKITQSGKVKLSEERIAVRPEIDFVELKTNEETVMDKEKFVAELIANEASQFEEENKSWLTTLDEKQLEKLVPAEPAKLEGIAAVITPEMNTLMANVKAEDLQKTVEDAFRIQMKEEKKVEQKEKEEIKTQEAPKTVQEYIAAAPTELQEVLNSGIKAHNSRREELVSQIKANAKNKFEDKALAAMPLETLENLATLAVTDDYSTRGGPRYNEEDPNAIPAPPQVFDLTRKAS